MKSGVLWAGSDDGLVHVSQDDGKTWIPVTPAHLSKSARIDCIEPPAHHAGAAYLAATRHRSDDNCTAGSHHFGAPVPIPSRPLR
jgi:hypothetical protein